MDSLAEGVQRYSSNWYQIDQLHRKFTYHVRMSGQASLMGSLTEQIENLYSNNYLLKLGDRFQTFVDTTHITLPVLKVRKLYSRTHSDFSLVQDIECEKEL